MQSPKSSVCYFDMHSTSSFPYRMREFLWCFLTFIANCWTDCVCVRVYVFLMSNNKSLCSCAVCCVLCLCGSAYAEASGQHEKYVLHICTICNIYRSSSSISLRSHTHTETGWNVLGSLWMPPPHDDRGCEKKKLVYILFMYLRMRMYILVSHTQHTR